MRALRPLLIALPLAVACDSSSPSSQPLSLNGRILFIAATRVDKADIYSINPDGTGLRNLTNHPAFYDMPAPSPDGTAIAFYRGLNPSDSGDVYVMDANGTRRITFTDAYETGLTWSPDGQRLAFVKNRDIYTMAPDGSDTTRLTLDGADHKSRPAWSPDGAFIAYSRYVGAPLGYDLHRITASGQADTVLASFDGDDLDPAWSGSGTSITFVRRVAEFGHLVRLDLATGDTITLTSGAVVDQSPVYSPLGDTLAFFRFRVSTSIEPQEVFLLLPGNPVPVPVTAFGTTRFAYSVTWTDHP